MTVETEPKEQKIMYYDGSDGKGEWWDAKPMDRVLHECLELESLKYNSLITNKEYMEACMEILRT